MNSYYHSFAPGFNWWYILAGLFVVIVAVAGYNKYYIYAESVYKWHLVKRYGDRFIYFVAGVCTSTLLLMVIVESRQGVVQFFDNRLTSGESPVWSILVASVAIPLASILYCFALSCVGRYVAKRRKAALKRRLRRH